jgi:hypothetical protein
MAQINYTSGRVEGGGKWFQWVIDTDGDTGQPAIGIERFNDKTVQVSAAAAPDAGYDLDIEGNTYMPSDSVKWAILHAPDTSALTGTENAGELGLGSSAGTEVIATVLENVSQVRPIVNDAGATTLTIRLMCYTIARG